MSYLIKPTNAQTSSTTLRGISTPSSSDIGYGFSDPVLTLGRSAWRFSTVLTIFPTRRCRRAAS
jgi:hypothetical protein